MVSLPEPVSEITFSIWAVSSLVMRSRARLAFWDRVVFWRVSTNPLTPLIMNRPATDASTPRSMMERMISSRVNPVSVRLGGVGCMGRLRYWVRRTFTDWSPSVAVTSR